MRLGVQCKFSGIVKFPFDTLTCPIDIAGWSWDGSKQNLVAGDTSCAAPGDGFLLHQPDWAEESGGTTYREYTVSNVTVTAKNWGGNWPMVTYYVQLHHQTGFYWMAVIVPVSLCVARTQPCPRPSEHEISPRPGFVLADTRKLRNTLRVS